VFGIHSSEWAAVKKPSNFVLGFNAGLGHWTSQISRDIQIYPLPTFPSGHAAVVADTDTDVNYHLGFSLKYNFTPKKEGFPHADRLGNGPYIITSVPFKKMF